MLLGTGMLLGQAFCAAGIGLLARMVGRRLQIPVLLFFAILPVLLFLPAYGSSRTIVPVDHVMLLPPWAFTGTATRYNANLNDIATQLVPWAKEVRQAWKEGSLPWRNRWNGCGTSLAANPQAGAFSPFLFLTFPYPLWAGVAVAASAKLLLALTGMFLWLSELGITRRSCLLGAVAFALSFAVAPWVLFTWGSVIVLWPWAFFLIERLRDRKGGSRPAIALVGVFCCWALSGHPETAAMGALFQGIFLACRALSGDLPDWRRLFTRISLAAAVAFGLTAFLLIPQAVAIAASNRVRVAQAFSSALPVSATPHGPLSPWATATVILPAVFGDEISSPMIAGRLGPFPEIATGHFGLAALALALLILRPGSRRRRTELALLPPFLLGLAITVGQWPFFDLALRTPVLRFINTPRWLVWMTLGGSVIAAFELDRWMEDVRRDRRALLAPIVSCLAIFSAALAIRHHVAPLRAAAGGAGVQDQAFHMACAVLAAVAVIAAAAGLTTKARLLGWLPVIFAGVLTVELFVQQRRLYAFGPVSEFYPPTPMLQFLARQNRPFRVLGVGAVLFPNTNAFAGVEDVRTHDAIERRDYVEYLDRTAGYPPFDYFKAVRDLDAPVFDALNVRYLLMFPGQGPPSSKWKPVYSGPDGVVVENLRVLPRISSATSPSTPAPIAVADYVETTNRVSFRVDNPSPQPVKVVASFVDDGGWSAADSDGGSIPLRRTPGLLIEMSLRPGSHRIEMRYTPPGLMPGAAITILTMLAATIVRLLFGTAGRMKEEDGQMEG